MIPDNYLNYIGQLLNLIIIGSPLAIAVGTYLYNLYNKITSLSKNIDNIMNEFKPNGGGSMRDSVNRIESQVATIDLLQKSYIDVDSTIPMFQTDSKGFCVWANKEYLKLVGRPIEDVLGTGWTLAIPQAERELVQNEWKRSIIEKRPFEYSYHFQNEESKTLIYIRCRSYGNERTGYVGFIYKNVGE